MHVYTCVCVRAYVFVCVCARARACVCVYVCVCVYNRISTQREREGGRERIVSVCGRERNANTFFYRTYVKM